jgi:hypothetical protein
LWPIALIAAILVNPREPIRSKLLFGNFKRSAKSIEFRAFEFATPIPVLRYLPYLFAVVAGRLRLIGVEPLDAGRGAARSEEWELVRDEGRVGLFGPVQLTAAHDTPDEQCRIIEAHYVGTRSIGEDFKWMLRAVGSFVSARAWRSIKPPVATERRAMAAGTATGFVKDSSRRPDLASFERVALATRGPAVQREAVRGSLEMNKAQPR